MLRLRRVKCKFCLGVTLYRASPPMGSFHRCQQPSDPEKCRNAFKVTSETLCGIYTRRRVHFNRRQQWQRSVIGLNSPFFISLGKSLK